MDELTMPPIRAKMVRKMPKGEEDGEEGAMRRRTKTDRKQRAEMAEKIDEIEEKIGISQNILWEARKRKRRPNHSLLASKRTTKNGTQMRRRP
jgi:hypothetical protein